VNPPPADLPGWVWVLIVALGVVQVGLAVVALVVLARTEQSRLSLPKWLWAIVIIGVQTIEAVVFLVVGRSRAPAAVAQRAAPSAAAQQVRAVEDLFPARVAGDGSPAVEVSGLRHAFGSKTALDGVDLCVPPGSVFGFLGPNGAGKTTTIRVLLGLLAPAAGDVAVLGARPGEARDRIGFLPDVPAFYPWMTAPEALVFAGRLSGLDEPVVARRVPELLRLAGLDGVTTRTGGFSRGMKQRLGIAQSLVNAPALLLLDEPTSALDPVGRKEVLDMIESLRGRTSVLFSTHILADAERVCDQVAVLDEGVVLASGPLRDVVETYAANSEVRLTVAGDAAPLTTILRSRPWVLGIADTIAETGEQTIVLRVSDVMAARREVPRIVADRGLPLVQFDAGEATLEDAFLALVQGASQPRPSADPLPSDRFEGGAR
jgi:ABC-2 type transport system ATP-binding protein